MMSWVNLYNRVKQDYEVQNKKIADAMSPLINSLVQKRVFDLEKQKQSKQIGALGKSMGVGFTPIYDKEGNMLDPELQKIGLAHVTETTKTKEKLRADYPDLYDKKYDDDKISITDITIDMNKKKNQKTVDDWIQLNGDKSLPPNFKDLTMTNKLMTIQNLDARAKKTQEQQDELGMFAKKEAIKDSFENKSGSSATNNKAITPKGNAGKMYMQSKGTGNKTRYGYVDVIKRNGQWYYADNPNIPVPMDRAWLSQTDSGINDKYNEPKRMSLPKPTSQQPKTTPKDKPVEDYYKEIGADNPTKTYYTDKKDNKKTKPYYEEEQFYAPVKPYYKEEQVYTPTEPYYKNKKDNKPTKPYWKK